MRIPIASDGWRFILPLAISGALLVWYGRSWSVPLGILGFLTALFCAYFFRDFERHTPPDPAAIYSPADGKVLFVGPETEGPYKGQIIIRIFLSVLNVHVQRSPVDGRVLKVEHRKGSFFDARHERAHLDNEQNLVTLETPRGPLVVNQIAGLIARRIVCWVGEGAQLRQGERYGLIRFGSQVDVVFPGTDIEIAVKKGERVVAGETVLARWK